MLVEAMKWVFAITLLALLIFAGLMLLGVGTVALAVSLWTSR